MSINKNPVRSAQSIKENLLQRAFMGASRYSFEEMKEKIAEAEQRVKDAPSPAEILGNVFNRLSGGKKSPSVEDVNRAMGDSDSRTIRTFNMISYLERSENGQYKVLKEEKARPRNSGGRANDNRANKENRRSEKKTAPAGLSAG